MPTFSIRSAGLISYVFDIYAENSNKSLIYSSQGYYVSQVIFLQLHFNYRSPNKIRDLSISRLTVLMRLGESHPGPNLIGQILEDYVPGIEYISRLLDVLMRSCDIQCLQSKR